MVKNLGIAPLNSFKLLYALDANPYDTITWLGLAAMDSTRTVVLPTLYLKGDGHHQIKTRVILPNGVHVAESYANQFVATIEVNRTPMDPPLNEYFKRPHFPYSGWFIHNQNRDGNSWYQISDKSYPGNFTQTALFLRSFTMMPGTVNEFYLPEMAVHQISPMVLSFDVCLVGTGGAPDTLSALMSDNCGLTWTEVYRKTGSELAFTSVPWPEFPGGFPDSTNTEAWKQQIINVTGYNSNSNLLVKIKHIHGHGNNLSIRNLHFGPQLGIHDKTDIPIKVSPNPTTGILWIHSKQCVHVQSVDILNALGKIVRSFKPETLNNLTYEVNLSDQPTGIYLLKINTLNGFKTITTILVK
jgi:hypothetical protein